MPPRCWSPAPRRWTRYGLTPRARIVTAANAGIEPHIMGLGPVPSTEKALARVGWSVADLEAVELNEAFAAQSIGVLRELKLDEDVVNADGGAIALGHPLGCSGARILVTLLHRMEREGARRGHGEHVRRCRTRCFDVGGGGMSTQFPSRVVVIGGGRMAWASRTRSRRPDRR